MTYLPDEFEQFLEHINQLHYEHTPDYELLRSFLISAMHRLGYNGDDPYDWEPSLDHDETDSIAKAETGHQQLYSQGDDRMSRADHRIPIQRNVSTPPKARRIERGTQQRRP